MNDQPPFDCTMADRAPEAARSPAIERSPPDPMATIAGPAPQTVSAPVTLLSEEYVVGREIARGGMGSVLQAEDRKLGRIVAMKVMRLESTASESSRARFVREATVLARLAHPNIVPIYELGWDAENRLFYTMKLVQGRTLQAVLNGLRNRDADFIGHYTLDRLLTIFRKVCDAMSMAHAKGVIHRDLKPENIMVGEFGEVLVMDWGLARILTDAQQVAEEAAIKAESTQAGSAERFRQLADSQLRQSAGLTMDGAVMGTPFYMSPEQARGQLADIDQQSDIFSLGGILYALLTLHPPVDGKTADDIMSRIKRGEILPPTAYNVSTKSGSRAKTSNGDAADPKKFQPLPHCPHGRVPSALSAVTMRALAVNKFKRYKAVAELAADIEAYQGGFATRAEVAGLFTQLRLLVKRHKREFAVAFAAWVLITALAVWFVINLRASERETGRQARIARENESKAVAEARHAASAEQVAKDQATRALAAGESARASEALAVKEKESARQALAQSALSLAEAARREENTPAMQAALNQVPEDLRDSTWNYLLEQSDTSIARVRGSAPNVLLEGVAASPRRPGVFAAIDSNNNILITDVRTGERLAEFPTTAIKYTSGFATRVIAFSPDGQRIAAGRGSEGESRIGIYSAADGKKLLEWTAPGARRLEFSPDGKLLLQDESSNRRLSVWNTADGKLAWDYTPQEAHFVRGAFTVDGMQAVTASRDGIRIANAADGTLIRTFKAVQTDTDFPLLLAGDLMVSAGLNGFVVVCNIRDGHVVSEFRVHALKHSFVGFVPGGEQLVSAVALPDGRQSITLWDARTGERVRSLLGGSGDIRGGAIHPLTGELLVSGPNSRAWSLIGEQPAWDFKKAFGSGRRPVFWGSDDLLFASGNGALCGLQKLEPGKLTLLWKPAESFDHGEASADGKVAVMWSDMIGTERKMQFLRNAGPNPDASAAFKIGIGSDFVRLSPTGDRAWFHDFNNGLNVQMVDTTTGEKLPVKLDRKGMKKIWDFGWVAGGKKVVALVTAVADRGNPGSEERIILWDAATGKIVASLSNLTVLGVLAVDPDGKRFAEAGDDKMVRIRDAQTLAVLREFRAHDGPITALAWHPTKPILATASADLTMKIWNLDSGRRLEELRLPLSGAKSLAFSPSGRRLGCAFNADSTRVWEPRSLNDQPAATQPDTWEDLLATLTPETVEQTGGGWRMENGALSSPDKEYAKLPLPGNFAGVSYQIHVKLRQLAPKRCFHLEFPVADRMVGFELDGLPKDGFYTGLQNVNAKRGNDVPGSVHGKIVNDSDQHDMDVIVLLFGPRVVITVKLDGLSMYEWSGPVASLSSYSRWRSTPGAIALGAMAGDWVVYELKVKRQ